MATRTQPYVVRGGDYLTSIAFAAGVSPNDVWADPANAALRKLRANPELLAPGDVLYIPIVDPTWHSADLGSSNAFVAKVPTVTVHVALKAPDGTALAGRNVTTEPELDATPLTTDGDGILVLNVPLTIAMVRAKVDPDWVFDIRVGGLDPADTQAGTVSRLRQLGYIGDESLLFSRARSYLNGLDADDVPLARGTALFQADQDLDVTGELDDDGTDALRNSYGF